MKYIFQLLIITTQLSGCASLGRGMAEAFLEKQQSTDTRICEITGKPFQGLSPFLGNKKGKMKVLMEKDIPQLEQAMEALGAPWTPGRVPEWRK